MGEFHFYYPRRKLNSTLARHAFIARRLRAPALTETRVQRVSDTRDMLVLRTRSSEPGILYVPYVDAQGCFYFASTETLSCSSRPRPLYLELARGQLSRLFNRGAEWITRGFVPAAPLRLATRRAVRRFAILSAADRDAPNYDVRCADFFKSLCNLSQRINEQYLARVLMARETSRWVTRFGFSAPFGSSWSDLYDSVFEPRRNGRSRPKIDPVFQTINPDFCWSDIERADGDYDWFPFDAAMGNADIRDLTTTIGPLLRWGETPPQYAKRYEEPRVREHFKKYVAKLLERDGKRTKRWIVATNVETRVEGIPLEIRLALAAQTVFEIRRQNPKAKAFLGFDQPFGDSVRRGEQDMTPLELALRVARRKVFDGFYLEVNFGLSPNATFPRDPMELHRFFDRWNALGVPICLGLSCPSAPAPQAAERDASTVLSDQYKIFSAKRGRFGLSDDDSDLLTATPDEDAIEAQIWTEAAQRETIRRFIIAALSHRNVDEIIWTKFADAPAPDAYLTGDPDSQPNPFIRRRSLVDEINLDDDDEQGFELADDRNVLVDYNPRDRDRFPTSGLFDEKAKPKSTLHKLSALRRAYID